MKGLWMELPPFSPDTSGFASVISGTDGMGLIDDVRGCAGNYFNSEEVRQDIDVRVSVSQLANEDTILGSEDAILSRFDAEYQRLHPSFAVLTLSPISSVIGTDLRPICEYLQKRYEIPVSHLRLDGHGTYDRGISDTLTLFAQSLSECNNDKKDGINIIGANYMDWCEQDMNAVCERLQTLTGMRVLSVIGGNCDHEQLRRAGEARLNWVVNVAGLPCARILMERFDTPYVCGAPFGQHWAQDMYAFLDGSCGQTESARRPKHGPKTLILSEQFTANALREVLDNEQGITDVTVASFFMMDAAYMQPQDIRFRQEEEFLAHMREQDYALVIGDPMLRPCIPSGCTLVSMPQIPLSARLFEDMRPPLLLENAGIWLKDYIN